jgi:hypothetical protein
MLPFLSSKRILFLLLVPRVLRPHLDGYRILGETMKYMGHNPSLRGKGEANPPRFPEEMTFRLYCVRPFTDKCNVQVQWPPNPAVLVAGSCDE